MGNLDGIAVAVFVFFFLLVTVLGFTASRWRRGKAWTASTSGAWAAVVSAPSSRGS